jgi:hypothetical protein
LAKLDKTQYTKEEWIRVRAERRARKSNDRRIKELAQVAAQSVQPVKIKKPSVEIPAGFIPKSKNEVAFIIGNGTSRKSIPLEHLRDYGTIYGCNALYREFEPDYLIAVDTKMILEINKAGFQKNHSVWTNPNKAYQKFTGFNYFSPSKGWSSGPTALHLASEHKNNEIYILGFDYIGLENNKTVNNIYADSFNYKKSHDGATYHGNWLKQTCITCQKFPKKRYIRVLGEPNFIPKEFNSLTNFEHITIEEFKKIFNIS